MAVSASSVFTAALDAPAPSASPSAAVLSTVYSDRACSSAHTSRPSSPFASPSGCRRANFLNVLGRASAVVLLVRTPISRDASGASAGLPRRSVVWNSCDFVWRTSGRASSRRATESVPRTAVSSGSAPTSVWKKASLARCVRA
jgi:hypothetical protein